METKLIEIRDRGTFIPAMATKVAGSEHWLLKASGYGHRPYIILTKLTGPECQYDPYKWGNARTMQTAHQYIIDHWDQLQSGDMVDVRVLLGESTENAPSERIHHGLPG